MVKVGITGGIGSGKSTVAAILEEYNYPVFYADKAGREAETDPYIRSEFIKLVGEDILVDGQIDRNKMRSKVFNNPELLRKTNELIGPFVIKKFNEFIASAEKQGAKIVFMESAILFDVGADKLFDFIISVIADKETRIKRVCVRDNMDVSLVQAKINVQSTDEYKVKNSNFIIVNESVSGCETKLLLNKQLEPILTNLTMISDLI